MLRCEIYELQREVLIIIEQIQMGRHDPLSCSAYFHIFYLDQDSLHLQAQCRTYKEIYFL